MPGNRGRGRDAFDSSSVIVDSDADAASSPRSPFVPQHEWTEFELNTVLALLCRGMHTRPGGALTFATALNEALNGRAGGGSGGVGGSGGGGGDDDSSGRDARSGGGGRRANYDADIPVEEVEALLLRLRTEKKAALAYIGRTFPARITRAKKRVFDRNIGFDGSVAEWLGGRRDAELARVPERLRQMVELHAGEERQARQEQVASEEGRLQALWYDKPEAPRNTGASGRNDDLQAAGRYGTGTTVTSTRANHALLGPMSHNASSAEHERLDREAAARLQAHGTAVGRGSQNVQQSASIIAAQGRDGGGTPAASHGSVLQAHTGNESSLPSHKSSEAHRALSNGDAQARPTVSDSLGLAWGLGDGFNGGFAQYNTGSNSALSSTSHMTQGESITTRQPHDDQGRLTEAGRLEASGSNGVVIGSEAWGLREDPGTGPRVARFGSRENRDKPSGLVDSFAAEKRGYLHSSEACPRSEPLPVSAPPLDHDSTREDDARQIHPDRRLFLATHLDSPK